MFHLFNKVYLDFDHNISVYNSRVVFSKEYAAQCDAYVGKTQYYFSPSVKQSIGKKLDFKTYSEFFERCSEIQQIDKSPLIVYCDKDSFLSLFVAWHKVIFEEISSESLCKIWTLFLEKEKYLDAITHEKTHVHTAYFDELLTDKSEFDSFCKSINVKSDSEFVKKIVFDLGIEYILTSYLYTKSKQFEEILSKKLLLLIKRAIQGEIYEVKTELVLHSQNSRLKKIIGLDSDSTVEDIFDHETFSVFNDGSVWKKEKMIPSEKETAVDINAMSSDVIQALKRAVILIRKDYRGQLETSDGVAKFRWIDYLTDNFISKDEIEELIISDNFNAIEISDPSDRNHLNVLFIDWCLGVYRDGKTERLADFVLNA